ncbi:MAG: AAA family ATPase [Bacteroidales bacterium]|nr:AAA family ATPase [Bacteroidales bacterium]
MSALASILQNAVADCKHVIGQTTPRPRFCFPIDQDTAAELLAEAYRIEVEARRMYYRPGQYTLDEIQGVAKWLTNPALKSSLLLYGKPGTGKTTMARAILRMSQTLKSSFGTAGIDRQQRARGDFFDDETRRQYEQMEARIIVPSYCTALDLAYHAKEDREKYTRTVGSGFLIIDDIGPEPKKVNCFGTEYLPIVEAIQARYSAMKPTIITTNLGDQEIIGTPQAPGYGLRIIDRLNEMCERIAYCGQSYRI